MSKKTSRKAMLTSIIALTLCFAMLVGTTYAWFTDSVSSAGNIIKSGTLSIDVLVKGGDLKTADLDTAGVEKDGDYYSLKSAAAKNTSAPLFNYHLWEPGYTDWANVKVVNTGDLALKYTMRIIPSGTVSALAEVIDVYYAAEEVAKPATRSLAGLTRVGTLKEVLEGGAGVVINDHLLGKNDQGYAPDFATIALHMQESAGNEYQNLEIGSYFDLQIIATQYTYEVDSFNDQYDAQAVYPDVATVTVPANTAAATTITAGAVTVAVPANAGTDAQVYRLDVSNADTETDPATNETSVEFDATLYLNNVKVTSDNNENIYVLTLTIPTGATISSVTHNGNVLAAATTGADQTYTYDPATGVLTIYTKSFSPFAVTYKVPVPVTGVTLEPATLEVEMGKTETLTAAVSPDNADDKTVTWKSSNEAVATVADGVVTGVWPGTATITAEAGDYSAACTVTVYKEYMKKKNNINYSTITSASTGSDFLPIVSVNPSITAYSYKYDINSYANDNLITNEVHFRYTRVEKQTIDDNSYKVLVELAIKDADGNDLELKPSPNGVKEYLHVQMNTIDAAGYSVASVTVNGSALTYSTNSDPATGTYITPGDPKDVYLQTTTAGLIEITYTKAN
ncbi:MAG: Ig domain-containing protein [Clostridia bacterium]|nr:Ig domain-containing protein [Clostridia bacterium]